MYLHLNECLKTLNEKKTGSHFAVRIGQGDTYEDVFFSADGETVNADTLFDMASVTKVLSTGMLSLIAFDKGLLSPDDPVSKFYPCPDDKKDLTVLHLITHRIGFGWKDMAKATNDTVAATILAIPCETPVGTNVSYSCPAYILLGKILEQVYGMPLRDAFETYVSKPLALANTHFGPVTGNVINANRYEDKRGIVNDNNCRYIGGVAGNAGLFSSLNDLQHYIRCWLDEGKPLFSQEWFQKSQINYTPGEEEARGLGFLLVDETYTQTGDLFPVYTSFGHCGHTGQSIFVNRNTGFYVIVLSDMTRETEVVGTRGYGPVMAAREAIHNAILLDLKGK